MDINSVFYLKYRPQTLSEIVGQDMVKKTLAESFKSNKLSHAYLFVGPRGTGKTSMARILAKMVNCEKVSKSLDTFQIPCNECSACLSITDGSNLDLIEIDAASNRGIEDIRSLREKIKLAPSGSKKKVYIIDEVHMLTQEAFNALLKTLEEPPSHALFILATTEVSKVPQTILSRCQRLDFKLAKAQELSQILKKIIKEEGIEIDEDALKLLIKKSDGSFRDGVKLLDQVSSGSEKITRDFLEKSLKSSNFDDILDLIESIAKKDTKTSLSIILKEVENGADVKELILSLMDTLRSLVFIKNGLGDDLIRPHFTEDKYEQLVKVSNTLSTEDLVKSLNKLQNAYEELKFASIPTLPLELAMVEICGAVDQYIGESVSQKKQEINEPVVEQIKQPTEAQITDIPIHRPTDTPESDSPDISKLKEKWTFVLETIRPYNFSLEALLRSARVNDITDANVIMEVPYSFHQRILEAPKNRDILEGILSDILGRKIRVSCILGSKPIQRGDIANIEVAEDDEIIRVASEIFNSDSVN